VDVQARKDPIALVITANEIDALDLQVHALGTAHWEITRRIRTKGFDARRNQLQSVLEEQDAHIGTEKMN
jgi:hypothetical protein